MQEWQSSRTGDAVQGDKALESPSLPRKINSVKLAEKVKALEAQAA
jgi:hypothetical protein